MSTTMSRRLGAAVAAGAVIVGLAVGVAPAASAEEGADFVGPNSTSLELNGYPGLVGNSGFPVECVQRALLREPDGDYGQDTFDAIRRFQALHGLEVDGVVGPATGDRLIPSLPAAFKKSCYGVIPTTTSLPEAEERPVVPGRTVSEEDFGSCMEENNTGLPGVGKIARIGKLYTMLKKGKKVDGAEVARTVPGTDLLTMFSCLRHGPS
ncbi:peptidoglycan-binding domain-containing protein [Actinomycetospora sp. CA-084318]|uniref:peptidoglycan-binding domain-containing protein n=1 Tax=Actinomycetospora sp. CA-084318 TaxID=3239892 RepID=UPI003D976ECE